MTGSQAVEDGVLAAHLPDDLAGPADGRAGTRASTGVAISRPGDTAGTLLRRADAAMYEVTRSRR
jgi:GGDEF domain-containing protein